MRLGAWPSIACLVLVVFAIAGCGGDGSDSADVSQEPSSATADATSDRDSGGGESAGQSEDTDAAKGAGDEDGQDESPTSAGGSSGGADAGTGGRGGGSSRETADGGSGATGGGGGGGGGTTGPDTTQPGAAPGDDGESQSETGDDQWPPKDLVTVTIKDFKFSPQHVVVPKDGWIMWVNKETKTNHTATKTRGPSYAPNSPNIGWGGGTYTDTFQARGEIEYICTYHPLKMKGFITVK